jgi:hypothetical protein
MVVCKRPSDHFGVHIAAETQLDGNVLLLDDGAVRGLDVDHVAEPIGLPG